MIFSRDKKICLSEWKFLLFYDRKVVRPEVDKAFGIKACNDHNGHSVALPIFFFVLIAKVPYLDQLQLHWLC